MSAKNNEHSGNGRRPLEQDPRTGAFVRKIIQRNTHEVMNNQFPNANIKIIGESTLYEGASGAITVQVDSQMQLLFKFDAEKAAREIDGFLIMQQALPNHTLPLLAYDASGGWLCVPYLSAQNLQQVIKDKVLTPTQILTIYEDFLRKMFALWVRTYKKNPPNNDIHLERLQRKMEALETIEIKLKSDRRLQFSELAKLPTRINGVDTFSIDMLAKIAAQVLVRHKPSNSVTAHGDEHAKNILIQTSNLQNRFDWFLIDLPNVNTEADWTWSIAQMRQWWQVSFHIDLQPKVKSKWLSLTCFDVINGRFCIEYEQGKFSPEICYKLDKKVEILAHQTAKLFEDKTWLLRYAASKFLILYGLLPVYRHDENVLAFLIGEMVKSISPMLSYIRK